MGKKDSDFFPMFERYWDDLNLDIINAIVKPVSYNTAKRIRMVKVYANYC